MIDWLNWCIALLAELFATITDHIININNCISCGSKGARCLICFLFADCALLPKCQAFWTMAGREMPHNFFSSYYFPSALTLWHRPTSLTHWGRVTHICVGNLIIIVSDNGLSPGRRQAIIWTNAAILIIEPLGTNFSGILIEILTFSFN